MASLLLLSAITFPASGQGFPVTEADLAQVRLASTEAAVRQVTADKLEIFTRPVAEAAILDRLRRGALVPLVSEGGGWATIDLGGGFLGWMRSDGLGPVTTSTPQPKAPNAPVPAPVPLSRRPAAAPAAIVEEPKVRRVF